MTKKKQPINLFVSLAHGAGDFDFVLAGLDGLTFIRSRFASAQAQLQLGPATLEVNVQGNQSIALLPNVSGEALDLAFVDQELSGASGLVISRAGLDVRGDVDTVEKKLIVTVDACKALIEADLAGADTLNLGAEQVHACFQGLQDKVVMVGLAVDNARKVLSLGLGGGVRIFRLGCHSPYHQGDYRDAGN